MSASQPNKPGPRRPIYPPKPASAAATPGSPLAYETPRPALGRITRAWRWWKYHCEGPVGNVLAVAFIIALVGAYVYVRQAQRAHLQEIRTNRLQQP